MIKDQFKNIASGAVFKNYKELCQAIGEEPKTGNSRPKQLKEIEEWLKLRKDGWKYIVEEVYEKKKIDLSVETEEAEIKPKARKRGRPVTKEIQKSKKQDIRKYAFSKYIEAILMNYMLYKNEKKENPVSIGKLELYQLLGLVNQAFGDNYKESKFLKENNDYIDYKELNYVKRQTLEKIRPMIHQVLKSLERRRLLFHHWYYVIKCLDGSIHIATPEEEEKILWVERITLEEMGYDSITQVYGFKQVKEYYSRIGDKIFEFGWDYYSQRVELVFNEEHIISALEKTEQELLKIELNDNLCSYLDDKMKKDWRKNHLAFSSEEIKKQEEKDPTRALIRLSYEECMAKHKIILDHFIRYIQKSEETTEQKNNVK